MKSNEKNFIMGSSVEEVSRLLSDWEEEDAQGKDVTPILTRLAEIFELETKNFLKQDPDPFDDRHPSRTQPDCTLGHILKTVFRNERIVDEMMKVYSQRDVLELNTAVCRLLLDILPGLESVIFQEEGFVPRLFYFAEYAPNPLQSYATGLLAAAMDVPEIASSYREKNGYFVPLMLKRLKELSKQYLEKKVIASSDERERDKVFSSSSFGLYSESANDRESLHSPLHLSEDCNNSSRKSRKKRERENAKSRYTVYEEKLKEKKTLKIPPVDKGILNESSNSNWAESMLGSYEVFPLTLPAQQRYVIQYLTPLGEYSELIGNVFEENALALILQYIDLSQNHDVRLAFEALKYLASLLCHKKIAIEFLNIGGLKLLLKVPRPSIAATGVSFCFYYLGYLEEALEKICMSPPDVLSDLVSYTLYLLECSHDSSRCHATLFFGFGFAFNSILQHFDRQDGLRKLFNVMSTLDIFVSANARTLSDDEIFAKRLTTRHVCGSLKRYFEAHLAALVEEKRSALSQTDDVSNLAFSKAASLTPEAVDRNMEILHESLHVPLLACKPINEFVNLDGVTFLLELISSYFELSYSGRAETVKSALDVLKICALSASAQLKFCEKISSPDYVHYTGISVLLQAAEGEMMPVAEVQRSALETLINCVCVKIPVESSSRNAFTPKKKFIRHVEDLLTKLWKAVRIKNGIIVLINLLSIKTPVTDADSIRALACKALCGLARSSNVKQILNKFPLVIDGQLIDLMKEPVLQDKCQYHVQFCKYGLELIERVAGAPLSAGSEYSMNLNKICVSEVVAKTKVVYQDYQLIQLISHHLTQKGFLNTVECLHREMDEKLVAPKTPLFLGAFPSSVNNSNSVHQQSPTISSPRTFRSVEKLNKFFSISSPSLSSSPTVSSIPPPTVPLKIILNKKIQSPDIKLPPCRLQKPQICSGNYVSSPAFSKMKRKTAGTPFKASEQSISLDSIVTEYLRKQHAVCKNPMLACPPFDLFEPHKCPEPQFKRNASKNCVLRMQKREIAFKDGGYRGAALNTKHIYSRFRLFRTVRDEESCDFTTCAFFKNNDNEPYTKLLIGTVNGNLNVINANTAKQITSKDCHFRGITHIETRESSPLFITSDGGRIGNSSVWNFSSEIDLINNFSVCHLEFGKRSLERLIGTKNDSAVIFDTATFAELQTFAVEDLGNNYAKNRATFDFRDELVLSDGLIYDVRNGKMIHKLDKFNSTMNGIFHPNGREIICNSEIWDIRSFKLLRTVAGLDQCRVTFNNSGSVIYAVSYDKDLKTAGKMSCFYTFDAWDYNTIATVDVKRPVYHVASDLNDRFIATIESQSGLESICRLYEAGRTKQLGDENGDESEDSDDSDDDADVDDDNEGSSYRGQSNDVQFEGDEDNDEDEINWITTSDSSDDDDDDDEDTLFSLNTSFEE